MMIPFWMNFVDGGNSPTKVFSNKEEAKKETERLAKTNPGKHVYLMTNVGICQLGCVTWEETPGA